jgi:hypothetical protein
MIDKLYDLPENDHNGLTFIMDGNSVRNNTGLTELEARNNKKESA